MLGDWRVTVNWRASGNKQSWPYFVGVTQNSRRTSVTIRSDLIGFLNGHLQNTNSYRSPELNTEYQNYTKEWQNVIIKRQHGARYRTLGSGRKLSVNSWKKTCTNVTNALHFVHKMQNIHRFLKVMKMNRVYVNFHSHNFLCHILNNLIPALSKYPVFKWENNSRMFNGQTSLLYNGYRVFSRLKMAGTWRWPPTRI